MSSNLNYSSINQSASGNDTAYSSNVAQSKDAACSIIELADHLIAYFSTVIESKLPVTERDIDPAMSPELENIKVETNRLPDEAFQAFVNLFRLIESHKAELAQCLLKAQKSEPIPDDVLEDQQRSLMESGNAIINVYSKLITKHVTFVDESWEELKSRIREGRSQLENVKHWQERLDAVKDDVVPKLSTIVAPVQSAAKVAVGLAVCEISQKLDQDLQALGISNGGLRGDAQVVIKTNSKLQDYIRDSFEIASVQWLYACRRLYKLKGGSSATTLEKIHLANYRILQFISPIEKYLVRWNEKYGSGISVIREVDEFCEVVPKIIEDIERIFRAKEIIKRSHQAEFGTTVYNLGLTIFKYLGLMRDHFKQKIIDPAKQRQFLQVVTLQFTKTTVRLTDALRTILETQPSRRKSEKAEENRMADDRHFESDIWKNKTLVKPDEVLLILERVERTVDTISGLANVSGTGKIMESIRGDKIERADFKIDISIDSLRRLDRILGQDVDAGLERLQLLLIEQEQKAHAGQIKSFLRKINRKKC